MKVLVATNPECVEFVNSVVSPYQSEGNLVLVYIGEHKISDWEELNGIGYDIGISYMYQYKVPAKELSHTWFNFHPAPLPEYKGRNLCYHAIVNGAKTFGATIHYMDENFDTGDIIKVDKFPILDWWTSGDLSEYTMEISGYQFMHFFPRILAGETFRRYPNKGGTYYKKADITEKIILKPDEPFSQFVRAVTYKDFYPKIDIGGAVYKIVRDE